MISVIFLFIGLASLTLLYRRNRPAFVAGFILLFSLGYRMVDIAYLDLSGPQYAIELNTFVGGNLAAPMFIGSCLVVIAVLAFAYRTSWFGSRLQETVPDIPYFAALSRLMPFACGAFLGVMYLDMIRIGTIPLFAGMDRIDYLNIAGVLHKPFYELSFLLAAMLGMFTVLPRIQGKRYDVRFILLFLVMMLYWILTGNRFSIFFRDTSFFVLGFAAVLVLERAGILPRMPRENAWAALFSSRVIIPFAVVVGLSVTIALTINNYYEVRSYSDPLFQMQQRSLVQPVQLWAQTWQDVDFGEALTVNQQVYDQLFVTPLEPDGNTTVQYLMAKNLGYFRALELIRNGQQYAGGYPEILFELASPDIAIFAIFVFAIVTISLLRLSTLMLARGQIFSALMAVYVYFGFSLLYIGGLLNFLFATTFWVKGALLAASVIGEGRLIARLKASRAQNSKPGAQNGAPPPAFRPRVFPQLPINQGEPGSTSAGG